ncbi:MAG: hypothetical protein ABI763_08270 [Bacteroidota bacterium]
MSKVNSSDSLARAISLLEIKREEELHDLKSQFQITYESLKPMNVLKNTWKEITESPSIKTGISGTAVGIASGYIAKNILFGFTKNPIKKLAGIAIQALVTNLAANNSGNIIQSARQLINLVSSKISHSKKDFSESEIND